MMIVITSGEGDDRGDTDDDDGGGHDGGDSDGDDNEWNKSVK
jgi:hypothetical protein